mmetsp:Transcript_75859/g.234848  ORF Transcript_75859/g.234848 Transcript_75859/m.234848 type:complete len:200 (+) Transcript_75859:340-939(+)
MSSTYQPSFVFLPSMPMPTTKFSPFFAFGCGSPVLASRLFGAFKCRSKSTSFCQRRIKCKAFGSNLSFSTAFADSSIAAISLFDSALSSILLACLRKSTSFSVVSKLLPLGAPAAALPAASAFRTVCVLLWCVSDTAVRNVFTPVSRLRCPAYCSFKSSAYASPALTASLALLVSSLATLPFMSSTVFISSFPMACMES